MLSSHSRATSQSSRGRSSATAELRPNRWPPPIRERPFPIGQMLLFPFPFRIVWVPHELTGKENYLSGLGVQVIVVVNSRRVLHGHNQIVKINRGFTEFTILLCKGRSIEAGNSAQRLGYDPGAARKDYGNVWSGWGQNAWPRSFCNWRIARIKPPSTWRCSSPPRRR